MLVYGQLPERRADILTLDVVAGLHAGVTLVKKHVDSVDRLIAVVVSPPDMGDGAIVNTRQQPGADRAAIRTVQGRLTPHGQKGLVHDVLRRARIPQQTDGKTVGGGAMPIIELLECRRLASGNAHEEVTVSPLSAGHRVVARRVRYRAALVSRWASSGTGGRSAPPHRASVSRVRDLV